MLSRKAMSALLPLYERFLYPPDIYTSIKAPPELMRCFSLEHVACQRQYAKSSNAETGADAIDVAYRKENLDYGRF